MATLNLLQSCPQAAVRVTIGACERLSESKKLKWLANVNVRLMFDGEEIAMVRGSLKQIVSTGRITLDLSNSMSDYENSRIQGLDEVGIDVAAVYAIRNKIGVGNWFSKEIAVSDGKIVYRDVESSMALPELSGAAKVLAGMATTIEAGDKAAQTRTAEDEALGEIEGK